ncbi:hypothetical protein [Clostridium chrysemydis]|uniref:hypothetical protein n=1 Tax=Clostridium chrysemydis TaxID=2665504 RepID=UPI0018833F2C|nr:hypothetical protein [Clostridium chrysemydis]
MKQKNRDEKIKDISKLYNNITSEDEITYNRFYNIYNCFFKNIKKLLAVIIIIVIFFIGYGAYKDFKINLKDPKNVIEKFYEYSINGDIEKALDYAYVDVRLKKSEEEDFFKLVKSYVSSDIYFDVSVLDLKEIENSNNYITYEVTYNFIVDNKKSKELKDKITLIKEEELYRVSLLDSLKDKGIDLNSIVK